MKNKSILIAAVFFFILFNTSFLWEKLPGLWDMGIMVVLFIGFLILQVVFLFQIIFIIKSRFQNKEKSISTAVLAIVLLVFYLYPYGVVDSSDLEEPNLIYAQYEGVANCTETLKMKKNSKFKHTSICFGVDEYEGTYLIVGDTIMLQYEDDNSYHSKFAYGIIELDSTNSKLNKGIIRYYKDLSDKKSLPLTITQFEL